MAQCVLTGLWIIVFRRNCVLACLAVMTATADAAPLLPPGDILLRHDLQHLNDHGLINLPLTTWPLAWEDIQAALADIDISTLDSAQLASVARMRRQASSALRNDSRKPNWAIGIAAAPSRIRWFQSRPRESAELTIGQSWQSADWALNLRATVVAGPDDGNRLRPDGTYVGKEMGNWLITAGWQDRWWGPGLGGSLILSHNARPVPGIGFQRLRSTASGSKWFRWAGPWTLSTFMGMLDDQRAVNDTLLFGVRGAIRPHRSLEIGISRTAQWCGNSRPCGASAFLDLLLGRDNRGVNVDPLEEPGNQIGGVDVRWSLPGLPVAAYMQWIGEDSRRGGPEIGSWLRQAGLEFHGAANGFSHRTHIEVSETSCRDGGFGFSRLQPDCGYEHGIYSSGYRYRGRSIGHGQDGDGLSYSLHTTLVQSSEQVWTISVRHMQLNRTGSPNLPHGLSTVPEDMIDAEFSVRRAVGKGFITAGVGFRQIERPGIGDTDSDITGLLQWSSF